MHKSTQKLGLRYSRSVSMISSDMWRVLSEPTRPPQARWSYHPATKTQRQREDRLPKNKKQKYAKTKLPLFCIVLKMEK